MKRAKKSRKPCRGPGNSPSEQTFAVDFIIFVLNRTRIQKFVAVSTSKALAMPMLKGEKERQKLRESERKKEREIAKERRRDRERMKDREIDKKTASAFAIVIDALNSLTNIGMTPSDGNRFSSASNPSPLPSLAYSLITKRFFCHPPASSSSSPSSPSPFRWRISPHTLAYSPITKHIFRHPPASSSFSPSFPSPFRWKRPPFSLASSPPLPKRRNLLVLLLPPLL